MVLFHEIARYLAEHLKMEILTNCLVHGNSFARSIRKISKIPKNTKNVLANTWATTSWKICQKTYLWQYQSKMAVSQKCGLFFLIFC